MDTAAYAAIRGFARGLHRAGIMDSDQAATVAREVRAAARRYAELNHTDKVDAIKQLADGIVEDAR